MRTFQSALGDYSHRVIELLHLASDLQQFGCGGFQMLGDHVHHCHIPLCGRCGKHKCARLDLIRDDRVLCPVELLYASDTDHVRSGSSDVGSHAVKEVGNVYNVRLFCHVFQDGQAFCHSSCHHHIDGGSHADHIKINMLSYQLCSLGNDLSVFDLHVRSQGTEPFEMLVDGTAADIAASGKRHFRALIFSKKSSQKIVGCPDLLDIVILDINACYAFSVDLHCMPVHSVHHRADPRDGVQKYIDVIYIRKIIDHYSFIAHNCRRKNSKGRILCSAYLHFTDKRIAAFNNILFHTAPRSLSFSALTGEARLSYIFSI